jgi:hypothetical protein
MIRPSSLIFWIAALMLYPFHCVGVIFLARTIGISQLPQSRRRYDIAVTGLITGIIFGVRR